MHQHVNPGTSHYDIRFPNFWEMIQTWSPFQHPTVAPGTLRGVEDRWKGLAVQEVPEALKDNEAIPGTIWTT